MFCLYADGTLSRSQNDRHGSPLHGWLTDDISCIADFVSNSLEQFFRQVLMHYFTASEPESNFDFITAVEKSLNLLGLHIEVVVANFGSHLNFAQRLSVVALFFLALVPLVAPFAVVHHFADRGVGVGGYFYKIELLRFGYLHRFSGVQVA